MERSLGSGAGCFTPYQGAETRHLNEVEALSLNAVRNYRCSASSSDVMATERTEITCKHVCKDTERRRSKDSASYRTWRSCRGPYSLQTLKIPDGL
jgi:hypothetical protein